MGSSVLGARHHRRRVPDLDCPRSIQNLIMIGSGEREPKSIQELLLSVQDSIAAIRARAMELRMYGRSSEAEALDWAADRIAAADTRLS